MHLDSQHSEGRDRQLSMSLRPVYSLYSEFQDSQDSSERIYLNKEKNLTIHVLTEFNKILFVIKKPYFLFYCSYDSVIIYTRRDCVYMT